MKKLALLAMLVASAAEAQTQSQTPPAEARCARPSRPGRR